MNYALQRSMLELNAFSPAFGEKVKFPQFNHWPYLILILMLSFITCVYAGPRIPGADAAEKLEAAGTVLRIVDTALFVWGARLFSGISILSAGYNLKEQRFGVAIICIIAAIILGTAPIWVENIFSIGGGNGIFN
jgi:hypothetical protein